jgi:predicted ArsR family transcriptional regulator
LTELKINIPDEMRAPLVQNMLATFWMSTVLAFAQKYGTEESLEIAGPMMESIGRSKVESMRGLIPPLEENALGLGAWGESWSDLMGIEGENVEVGPERCVRIDTKCPVADAKADPVVCDLMTCSLKGAGSVIAPGFIVYRTHSMTKGDKYCRYVIERAKE